MKIISKINSISSLNDKNLEKFSLGNNNNNRFLVTKSSYIDTFDFLPGGSQQQQQQQRNYNTMDSQMLNSAKSLKFNNNSSDNSSASAAVFWDFTKPTLSSLPTTSNTNLRNTVSSSNLTLNNLNYGDNNQMTNQMIPLVLPQKFQFNQPQAQPVMKQTQQPSGSSGPPSSSSSSLAIQQQQQQQQDDQLQQLLCNRKNSLPHSSNLINNNHTTTTTLTAATISSNNESNVNGVNVSNRNNGKMCPTTAATSSNNVVNTSTSMSMNIANNVDQQQQQQQNGTTQVDGKSQSSQLKCPVVASPHQVMMLYMNKLTPYEHHEIYKYSEIYFIGANAKKRSGPNEYDNDNGSYIHIPHDHIAYRYEVLKIIGKGSFGQVVKAYDHKTREHVALKMVRNEKRFHRQAQEEIRILKHLRAQDKENTFNIIHM